MKKRMVSMLLSAVMLMGNQCVCQAESGKPVEITWLHHFEEVGIQNWMNEMIAAFEEENPDIKVNVEMVVTDVYDQTLKTKIASDDAPMLFDLTSEVFYKEYGEAGHLYDLSELDGLSNIEETMLPSGQVDGNQWAVPLDVNGNCIFYNKDMFDEYGLEVPTTVTEWKDVCEKLMEQGITPIAAPMADQWCVWYMFDTLNNPVQNDNEWWKDKMNLSSSFSDDQTFKDVVELFYSFKPYWGEDPFGTNWDTAQNMLANGEAAMVVNGSWTIDGVTSKNPDANIRACAVPTSESPEGAIMSMRPGSGFCLYNSEDEDKLEAGKKFLNFLLSKQSGDSYAKNAFKMSTVKGVDFSFSEALMDIQAYPQEQVWNSAGVTLFSSEYEQVFYENLISYTMEDVLDVDALAESLDKDFAAIGN